MTVTYKFDNERAGPAYDGDASSAVQRGYVNTSNLNSSSVNEILRYFDVTINSVNRGRSIIFPNLVALDSGGNRLTDIEVTIRFQNSTTIRIGASSSGASSIVGRWTVVEFI